MHLNKRSMELGQKDIKAENNRNKIEKKRKEKIELEKKIMK